MNIDLKNKTVWFTLSLFFIVVTFFMISAIFSTNLADASSDNSSLNIYNERVQPFYSGAVLFSWETSEQATSKVVYGETKTELQQNNDTISTINYGYTHSVEEVEIPVIKHSMLITGLSQGVSYSFRPISVREDGFESVGEEKTITLTNPCTYLKGYLRMGGDNDIEEVKKLQTFLRDFERFSELEVTGVFDQATFDAVSAFQTKYKEDILEPWGIDVPTGYVYYTTQKKINELYCNEEFSFNQTQATEINNFRTSLNGGNQDIIDFSTVGRVSTPSQEFDGVPIRDIEETEIVLADVSTQNEQIVPISEMGADSGTTTQSSSKGMIASVFSVAKNGVNAVLDSVRNFFKKDKTQEENLDSEEGSESAVSEDLEDVDID